jgi:hypothetical protein
MTTKRASALRTSNDSFGKLGTARVEVGAFDTAQVFSSNSILNPYPEPEVEVKYTVPYKTNNGSN